MTEREKPAAQAESERRSPSPPASARHDALAVIGFVAGPIAWVIDLSLSYFLVPKVHWSGAKWPMHLVTVLAVAIIAAGALAAVRVLRTPGQNAARDPGAPTGLVTERSRFLARGGLALSAFFLLAILAEALPKLLLSTRD
jgi:hypothetical protein